MISRDLVLRPWALVVLALDKPRTRPQIARRTGLDHAGVDSVIRSRAPWFRRLGRGSTGKAIVFELTDEGAAARLRAVADVQKWATL